MPVTRNRTRLHSLISKLSICTCASLLAFVLCSCTGSGLGTSSAGSSAASDSAVTEPVALETPSSYEDLFKTLQEKQGSSVNGSARGLVLENAGQTSELAPGDAASAASAADGAETAGSSDDSTQSASGSSNYSSTNVQVEGIDEGDCVKTDGSFIYSISDGDLVITQADGEQSRVRSRFFLDKDGLHIGSSDQLGASDHVVPRELFISDSTLAVLYDDFCDGGVRYNGVPKMKSSVALVDVSKPDEPVLLETFSQDGSLEASRLSDGTLTLVSSLWLYNPMPLGTLGSSDGSSSSSSSSSGESGDASDYVPRFYEGESSQPTDLDRLFMAPDCCDFSFTVVSTIDLQEQKRIDKASLAGRCDTLYMSADRLYLASASYETTESDPYRDSVYTVVDYEQKTSTCVSAFSLDDGVIEAVGSVSFEGELLNQFSLDEYDGNLRAATTVEKSSYKVLTDKSHDVESWNYDDAVTYNSLLVFNSDLELAGSVEDLAPDESIYSVRFDGPVGYVVTYEQVDPLFAIDLSDPCKPVVTSALKIPGFSRYLHPYSENRLLGLGQSTSAVGFDSQRIDGLKLSMFDTSDPFDVTEKNSLVLENSYSEALDDHRAVFVSAENDLIGFPSYDEYLLYGYSDDQGFYERAHIDTSDLSDEDGPEESDGGSSIIYMGSESRALYAGDSLYVVGESGMFVLDLNTLEEKATLLFAAD